MNKVSYFLVFSAALATVTAGPLSAAVRDTKDQAKPKDYFEDIIRLTLGMSVKELLVYTQTTFADLNRVTTAGVNELNEVIKKATPETKAEIQKVKAEFIERIFEIVGKLLVDLGNVLPKLSSIVEDSSDVQQTDAENGPNSAADIIWAILGISLENFCIAIQESFRETSDLLTITMVRFLELEKTAIPEVAAGLHKISEDYMMEGKAIVLPVLHDFEKLGV